jgi:hypothetical protein
MGKKNTLGEILLYYDLSYDIHVHVHVRHINHSLKICSHYINLNYISLTNGINN